MTRLISLVNRIMDYEKNDRKKLSLITTEHNLSEIIKNLAETHKKSLKQNKQRIKVT